MILSKSTAASKEPLTNGEKATSTGKKRHINGKLKHQPTQQTPIPATPAAPDCTTTPTKKPPGKRIPGEPKGVSANWQRLQSQLAAKKADQSRKKQTNTTSKQASKMGKKKNKGKKASANGETVAAVNGTPNGSTAFNANGDIWFDNVDPCLVKSSMISSRNQNGNNSNTNNVGTANKLCKETSFDGLTRAVAIDCEMVGTGYLGRNSILARVSIVNLYGHCIYDKFVKPTEEVTDYRTEVSGIRPENLTNADDFKTVQNEVYAILLNRVLVGHAVHHDLKVLFLSHPKTSIRDTSHYFKKFFNGRTPSLKKLTEAYLGVQIQNGEHDSITDAQATMRLYTLFKKKWEGELGKAAKSKRNKHAKTDIVPLINTSGVWSYKAVAPVQSLSLQIVTN